MLGNNTLRVPRSLDELKVDPVIVVDTREQTPLVFSRLQSERGTLTSGDYSIKGAQHLVAIERKTIPDLINCCTSERERFEKELFRLRAYRFRRLLIIGTEEEIWAGRYRSSAKPQSIIGSLSAWEIRFTLPVVFKPTAKAAAALVERWFYYFSREQLLVAANLARGANQTMEQPSSAKVEGIEN
jgi:DNA excision repair protein ERCC-4